MQQNLIVFDGRSKDLYNMLTASMVGMCRKKFVFEKRDDVPTLPKTTSERKNLYSLAASLVAQYDGEEKRSTREHLYENVYGIALMKKQKKHKTFYIIALYKVGEECKFFVRNSMRNNSIESVLEKELEKIIYAPAA